MQNISNNYYRPQLSGSTDAIRQIGPGIMPDSFKEVKPQEYKRIEYKGIYANMMNKEEVPFIKKAFSFIKNLLKSVK